MSDTKVTTPEAEIEKSTETAGSVFTAINTGGKEEVPTPTEEELETPATTTPLKKGAKVSKIATPKTPKTPKTPASTKKRGSDDADADTPKSNKRTKSSTPAIDRKGIPSSMAELSEEDKMMLAWKKEGKTWSAINKEWERLTGKKPGNSTLPNRYNRLKSNLTAVEPEDVNQLRASILAVDAAIKAEHEDAIAKKWARIAAHMKEAGVETEYSAATLEKHWKKMEAAAKSTTPEHEDSGTPTKENGIHASEIKGEDADAA